MSKANYSLRLQPSLKAAARLGPGITLDLANTEARLAGTEWCRRRCRSMAARRRRATASRLAPTARSPEPMRR